MRVAGIILLGVAMQMIISYILSLVLPMFPSLEQGYDEMMNDGATSELSAISLLVVADGRPDFRGNRMSWPYARVFPARWSVLNGTMLGVNAPAGIVHAFPWATRARCGFLLRAFGLRTSSRPCSSASCI